MLVRSNLNLHIYIYAHTFISFLSHLNLVFLWLLVSLKVTWRSRSTKDWRIASGLGVCFLPVCVGTHAWEKVTAQLSSWYIVIHVDRLWRSRTMACCSIMANTKTTFKSDFSDTSERFVHHHTSHFHLCVRVRLNEVADQISVGNSLPVDRSCVKSEWISLNYVPLFFLHRLLMLSLW